MVNSAIQWLESKPFELQLIILVSVLDPLGAIGGYLLAPDFGIDPIIGIAYGLVAASIPLGLWVMRHQQKHGV